MISFPQPAEITGPALDHHRTAIKIASAISDQHPGVQIAAFGSKECFEFDLKHPAHDHSLYVRREDGDNETVVTRRACHTAMAHYSNLWLSRLHHVLANTNATNANGDALTFEDGCLTLFNLMCKIQDTSNKFIFVGNGGSAAIASHMAEDFTKNGGVRAVTFNDAALMSCYANDYGWDEVFGKAVEHYGVPGDVLVAISSSGKSSNVHLAADIAKDRGIIPVTLSGFDPANPLRAMGQLNFYVPSHQYGFVETAHAAILHCVLDIFNGWVGQK